MKGRRGEHIFERYAVDVVSHYDRRAIGQIVDYSISDSVFSEPISTAILEFHTTLLKCINTRLLFLYKKANGGGGMIIEITLNLNHNQMKKESSPHLPTRSAVCLQSLERQIIFDVLRCF